MSKSEYKFKAKEISKLTGEDLTVTTKVETIRATSDRGIKVYTLESTAEPGVAIVSARGRGAFLSQLDAFVIGWNRSQAAIRNRLSEVAKETKAA